MTMTEATEFESAYNTHLSVPNHQAIVERWAQAAEQYRRRPTAETGLAYGEGPRHQLDMFWPEHDRNGPIVLFAHGGYWQAFDRHWFSHFARGLNAHGIPVAIPSYSQCPNVTLRDIIDELHACCMWLETHYGRSILAAGHSSGGHLAAALLGSDWTLLDDRAGHRVVRAAVTISGIFELAPLLSTSINANLHLNEELAHALSPVAWPAPSGTWLSALVGSDETTEFHRQSRMIVDIWGEHGVHTDLAVIDGANHYSIAERLHDPHSDVTEKIVVLCHSLE